MKGFFGAMRANSTGAARKRELSTRMRAGFSAALALVVGLGLTVSVGIAPASAAPVAVTVTADSITYIAGSGVIPTLTATVSTAASLNVTCNVYTTADTTFTTPIDMASIPAPSSGSTSTYKIHCTAVTTNSASYTVGTLTDGTLTVKPNNPLACDATFYQVGSGSLYKYGAATSYAYVSWNSTAVSGLNAIGWNTDNNYIYGLPSSGVFKQLDASGAVVDTENIYTNTAGASASNAPTHTSTLATTQTTGGDFYTFNGQQYLLSASSTGFSLIDVRSRSLVRSITPTGTWSGFDIAFKGNIGYGLNAASGVTTLYFATVSGTTTGTAAITVTSKALSAYLGTNESFGASYVDGDGNLFFFGNTSKNLYEIPVGQIANTNPTATLVANAGSVSSPNDGANCPTAASPTAATLTTTTPATSITSTAASLAGTISTPANPTGSTASAVPSGNIWFCYSTTSAGLSTSPTCVAASPSSLAANTSATAITAALTGLSPGTTYYFRSKAVNNAGATSYGQTRTLTTLQSWTLTANSATYTIGSGTPSALGAVASPSAAVSGSSTCAVYATSDTTHSTPITYNSSIAAGTYAIHCVATAASGYDLATLVDGTLTVTSLLSWTITGTSTSYQTPGTAPSATGTASPSAGLSGSLTCRYYAQVDTTYANALTISSSTAPGAYVVHCSGTPASGYAAASNNNGVLTVTATPWAIQAQNASYTIGSGSIPSLSAIATPSSGISGSAACAVYSRSDTLYATALTVGDSMASGSYVIHCTATSTVGYSLTSTTDGTLTVTTLNSWSLNAQSASYTIGGTAPTLSAAASPSGGLSGSATCLIYAPSDATFATALDITTLSAGAYVIRCTGTPATGYATASLNTAALTVTAPAASVTVTFNANDGSGSPATASQSITSGTATALTSNSFTRPGYTFAGWATSSGGSVTYTDAQSVTLTSALTLYAQWTGVSNAVTYDDSSATTAHSGGAATYLTGSSFTLPTTAPLRTGYAFAGWALTGPNVTSASLSSSATSATPTGYGALTLTAQWTAVANTVTYDDSSATTAHSGGASSYLTGSSFALPTTAPLRDGYTFAGWGLSGATVTAASLASGATSASPAGYGAVTLTAQWTAVSNAVTYDDSSATTAHSGGASTYLTGSSFALPTTAPLRSGYSFAGWAMTGSNVATASLVSGAATATPAGYGAVTVTAQWTAMSNAVTYDDNAATAAHSGGASTYLTGSSFTLPTTTPLRNGYVFAGWLLTGANVSSSSVSASASSATPAGYGAVTATAQWTAGSNTVTFNANDGSGSPATSTQSVTSGISTPLTSNAFTRAGYSFAGWSTTVGGTVAYTDGQAVTLAAPLTLYAQWTAGSNTVTFNANDGSGSPATTTQSVTSGTSTALTTNAFTRTGYTFAGWSTTTGGAVAYNDGQAVTLTAGLTLYAVWTANGGLVITYDSQGGTAVSDGSFASGGTVALAPSPTRTGYSFDGWFEASNGGSSLTSPYAPGVTHNVTLYAQWSANSNTVTFSANDGSGSPATSTQSITSGVSTALTANTFTRPGYTFAGWATTSGGSIAYTDAQAVTITGAVSLFAQWSAVSYGVSYDDSAATTASSGGDATYTTGSTFALPTTAPLRDGYVFDGWLVTGANVVSSSVTSTDTSTTPDGYGDVTVTAQWTAGVNTVTFSANDGSGSPATSTQSITTDAPTALSANVFSRPGYAFAGWATSSAGSVVYADADSVTLTGPLALFAQWSVVSYTVTYVDGASTTAHSGGAATYQTGSSFALPTTAPSRTGYSFSGWLMTGANIVSMSVAPTVATTAPAGYGNVTLSAQWTSASPPPVVTPPSSGGTSGSTGAEESGPVVNSGGSVGQAAPTAPDSHTVAPESSTSIRSTSIARLAAEEFSGFAPSAGIGVGVTGARTVGQFVLSGSNLTDSLGIAAALTQSMQQDGASFARLMSFSISASGPMSGELFSDTMTPELVGMFSQSGLSQPRSVQDLRPGSGSWLSVVTHLSGYLPGSTVYLVVTTEPTILGSVSISSSGEADLTGYLPIGGLESGAHNLRVVGTRQIAGVRSDTTGTIQLSDTALAQIRQFDQGTTATVVLTGATSTSGTMTAIRQVYLNKVVAWWTIYLAAIVALLALLSLLIRRPARPTRVVVTVLIAVAAVIPAAVMGWQTWSYELWWAIPLAFVVPIAAVRIAIARARKGDTVATPALA